MKLEIKNQSLFIEKAYINGQWVDADDNSTLDVLNPVNQEIIGRVPNCGATETNVAINAAAEAQKKWQKYFTSRNVGRHFHGASRRLAS